MKRLHLMNSPSAYEDGNDVALPVPVLALAEIVKALGRALRDYDEVAALMLKAADEPTWRNEQTTAAVQVLAYADLLRVSLTYPAGTFLPNMRELVANLTQPAPSTPTQPEDEPIYRLCSSCQRLKRDCFQGTPTTCASCAERTTR